MSGEPDRILAVDDEPQMRSTLSRTLRFNAGFDIATAESGADGLQQIATGGPFAVVISDLHMPLMDGITFLARVRDASPDTVRILLTGGSDFDSAVHAVNEGNVFRFLRKPCPGPDLIATIRAALEQHRLLTAERVLLQDTLRGSIKTVTNVLSLLNPEAFARGNRVKERLDEACNQMGVKDSVWEIEVAAMLSQIGSVTLPRDTAGRYYDGEELTPPELAMVDRLPSVSADLLGDIPRLEHVTAIITYHAKGFDGAGPPRDSVKGDAIPFGARLLRILFDYDRFESRTRSREGAVRALRNQASAYDPEMLDVVIDLIGREKAADDSMTIRLADLEPGMILAEDVKTETGLVFMGRGQEITLSVMDRIHNVSTGFNVIEPIVVYPTDAARAMKARAE